MNYDWQLKDGYPFTRGIKAFGTFVCGGGSTMGYKLAGCDHLGGVEIDNQMAQIYRHNHRPRHFYQEDIRIFNQRNDLPEELYQLDILDGSPPCSTFSMAGHREKVWGKEKKFREGQVKQVLDDLVFVYCDTVQKLKPKIAILENVRGLISGKAKDYAVRIWEKLESIGYSVQLFLLNSATMGVPQSRERVFFIARRNDLNFPRLTLSFNERPVTFSEIVDINSNCHRPLSPSLSVRWPFVEEGETTFTNADARYRNLKDPAAFYGATILYNDRVAPTLTCSGYTVYWNQVRNVNDKEIIRMSTFPSDFDFLGANARYVCGMSVPPLMTAAIAGSIIDQWFPNR